MKKLIAALLLFSVTATAADQIERTAAATNELRSTLNIVLLNANHQLFPNIALVEAKIDLGQGKILASFKGQMPCPPLQPCIQMLQEVGSVEVPLEQVLTNRCGSKIYRGSRDQRPVDGPQQVLIVIDNTTNQCPHTLALPATELVYESEFYDLLLGDTIKARSTFASEDPLH